MFGDWRTRRANSREKVAGSKIRQLLLRNGSKLHLRSIQPGDDKKLLDLYGRLSTRSLYNRFFTIPKPDPAYAAYLAKVDGINHLALVAETDEKIVAVGRFIRKEESPDIAEISFTVADAWQGQGLGSLMLARLTDVARQQGIGVFECQMLAENQPMMKMLARSGFVMEQRLEAGFFQVTLRINA
jgi:RimJ/RimL family protein N-acetyltransferase